MHRRPSGVTLSAVVLGIFSLFTLISGLLQAMLAVLFAGNPGIAPVAPGQPAPPPHLMTGIFAFFALITLLCATWGFLTMIGLMRMRNWARISVMVIGGCLTVFSLIELCGITLVQLSLNSLLAAPNAGATNPMVANPDAMRPAFFVADAFCAAVVAIGIWWLVYFALRRTHDAFRLVALIPALTSTAQLNPAIPITDFSVAQPVLAAPATVEVPVAEAAPEAPVRPISMIVVAILMFLGAFSLLFCCVLPYPLFFFGIQFSGWSAHSITLSMAILYALAAYGLLRRMYFGWLLAVGVQCLGLLNILTMLSPPVRDRWLAYTRELTHSMTPTPNPAGLPMQMMQEKIMSFTLVPSLVLGVVLGLVMLVLLWRAHWWYRSIE